MVEDIENKELSLKSDTKYISLTINKNFSRLQDIEDEKILKKAHSPFFRLSI